MKRNTILLQLIISLLALSSLGAQAAEISSSQAQRIAASFLAQSSPVKLKSATELQLAFTAQSEATGQVSYYAFNVESGSGGYVLVLADDDTDNPVLGYADTGSFDAQELPCNMQWWLSEVTRLADRARSQGLKVTSTATSTRRVKPLLGDILWNQSAPYNQQCPTYTSGSSTKTAVTGCVATAMAQIMRYHQWPEKGEGSNSYTCNLNGDDSQSVELSADFSQSTYDWANMPGTVTSESTDEQKQAVSLLMRDCGYSVNMGYGSSSGAVSRRVLGSLAGYFSYDKGMRFLYRAAYTLADWCSIIDAELQASRPVFYTGTSTSGGGHAFVLDGADGSGYYHINWGWGGTSNGYFLIPDLTPGQQGIGGSDGGYVNGQSMCVGIQKDQGTSAVTYSMTAQGFAPEQSAVKLGSSASFKVTYLMPGATTTSTMSINLGIGLYDAQGNLSSVVTRTTSTGLKPNYNYNYTLYYSPDAQLAEGQYTLRLVWNNLLATGDWTPVDVYRSSNPEVTMRVTADSAYFTGANHTSALTVQSLSTACTAYDYRPLLVNATLANSGQEYWDDVSVALLDEDGEVDTQSEALRIVVPQGDSTTISLSMTPYAAEGQYTLVVLDANDQPISGMQIPITVQARPANVSLGIASQLSGPSTMSPSYINAQAVVKNTGGAFTGTIEAMILPASSNTILAHIYTNFLEIKTGESKTLRFSGDFSAGQVGTSYRMVMRSTATTTSYRMWGNAITFTLRDAVPGDVNADGLFNISDITTQISATLGEDIFPFDTEQADQNGDGVTNVTDTTALINLLLNQ